MDRYGASTRDSESDYVYVHDRPRRSGERSGRDHRSRFPNDESGQYTPRARRMAFSHAYPSESDYDPSHSSVNDDNSPRRHRRDRSPITLAFDYNDPENFGPVNTSVGGYAIRRPNPRDCPNDDDGIRPRATTTRGGRSGPGLRCARGSHARPELSFTREYSEGESGSHSGSQRRRCGPRERGSMAYGSSSDNQSEDRDYTARWGGRDARGGVRSRLRGRDASEEDDSDQSKDGGVRGRRQAARGYGGVSRR